MLYASLLPCAQTTACPIYQSVLCVIAHTRAWAMHDCGPLARNFRNTRGWGGGLVSIRFKNPLKPVIVASFVRLTRVAEQQPCGNPRNDAQSNTILPPLHSTPRAQTLRSSIRPAR
ncbi:unnamed protein product, partial [Scytosiphon promiscuus]